MSTRDRHERIVTMWIKGEKSEFIAATVGTSRGAITRYVRVLGLPPRLPGNRRALNLWPCIVSWARLGHTPEQIADAIGATGKSRSILLRRNRAEQHIG